VLLEGKPHWGVSRLVTIENGKNSRVHREEKKKRTQRKSGEYAEPAKGKEPNFAEQKKDLERTG